jgi:hypothetical protein
MSAIIQKLNTRPVEANNPDPAGLPFRRGGSQQNLLRPAQQQRPLEALRRMFASSFLVVSGADTTLTLSRFDGPQTTLLYSWLMGFQNKAD